MIPAPADVGRWNEELFQRFRKARSQTERRELLDALLRTNAPLVKILVGQLAGIADEKTSSRKRKPTRMKVVGADEMPWDDLMQAGYQGMAHALGKFNPEKGKISGYARWWILTNLQRLMKKEQWVRAPKGEKVDVSLFDWSDRDALEKAGVDQTGGASDVDESHVEDVLTIDQLDEWEDAGTWPPEMLWARPNYLRLRMPKAYSIGRRPIDVFLERMCVFGRRADRAPLWPLWNSWRLDCLEARRPEGTRADFLATLAKRDVVEKCVRYDGTPQRGLARVKLVS